MKATKSGSKTIRFLQTEYQKKEIVMSISQIPPGLQAYQKLAGTQSEALASDKAQKGQEMKFDQIAIRNENQASLVAHLFGNSDEAIGNALKMTYQSAITNLNDILAPDLGENAISLENLEKQGGMEYWSPENTADRILSGATGFLEGFKKVHPELEGEELMNKFMEVVGGGLQQGFDEAQGILEELKVFDGMVKDNFTATTDLVNKGMENFRRDYLGLPPLEEAEATPDSDDTGTDTKTV
jgi:hypothetical protein